MFSSLTQAGRAAYHQTTGHRSSESGVDGSTGGDAGVGGMPTTDADVQLHSEVCNIMDNL